MKSKNQPTCPAVAVTGGIGTGKSEAAGVFHSLGATVISSDALAKELMSSRSDLRKKIGGLIGPDAYRSDGSLNTSAISKRAFHDPGILERLNKIVHPAVIDEIKNEISRCRSSSDCPMIVVESALVYEANIAGMFDIVIVVKASDEIRLGRLEARGGLAREEILDRMRAQLPLELVGEKADFVIYNNGSREELSRRCEFLFRLITSMRHAVPG